MGHSEIPQHAEQYQYPPDYRDLLESVSDILSFLVQATISTNENGLSHSGAIGLCNILDHCNTLVRRAGGF